MNEETRLKLIIDKESTYGLLRRQRRNSKDRSKSSLRKQALDSCVDSRRIASKHPHKGTRIDGRVNQVTVWSFFSRRWKHSRAAWLLQTQQSGVGEEDGRSEIFMCVIRLWSLQRAVRVRRDGCGMGREARVSAAPPQQAVKSGCRWEFNLAALFWWVNEYFLFSWLD